MKLLLTSAGIKNTSIRDALVDLLGKPIAQSNALCIPTAIYAFPGGAGSAWKLISGRAASPLCELGWKSLGVLELTALPSIDRAHWTTAVEETDALLAGGGDPLYLGYWIQQSGLADLIPSLRETVWVGVSGGSLVMGPHVGEEFVYGSPNDLWRQGAGTGRFRDVPAPGPRGDARPFHGQRRTMGWQPAGAGVRDRRRDRHQSGRQHRRSRLRGTLGAIQPRPERKRVGLEEHGPLGCASVRECHMRVGGAKPGHGSTDAISAMVRSDRSSRPCR